MIKEKLKAYREIISYVFFGGLTTLISLGSYYLCVCTFLDPANAIQLQIANIISWICAVSFAYLTNRRFVFRSDSQNRIAEAARFVGSRLTTLAIDMGCMFVLVSILALDDKIAKILVQFIVLISNYLFSKFLVFQKKKNN